MPALQVGNWLHIEDAEHVHPAAFDAWRRDTGDLLMLFMRGDEWLWYIYTRSLADSVHDTPSRERMNPDWVWVEKCSAALRARAVGKAKRR